MPDKSSQCFIPPPETDIDCNRDWCGIAGYVRGNCCYKHAVKT